MTFAAHAPSGIFYPCIIVEVRPEEFERIEKGELALPDRWTLGKSYIKPTDEP